MCVVCCVRSGVCVECVWCGVWSMSVCGVEWCEEYECVEYVCVEYVCVVCGVE